MERPKRLLRGDKELAEFLGICLRSVEKMNHEGKLDAARYKIGTRNAYDAEKILEIFKY